MPAASRSRVFRLEHLKAAPAPDAGDEAQPKKPAIYKFRANDGEFDRYQDRLSVKGWQLDAFNLNPVLLYNHDAGDGGWLGLGAKDVLPIGKARVFIEGDALMAEVEFDQDDEFARKVESKVAKGILSAVSVRYIMKKYHDNERGGVDSEEQELLELSIVTIPGNQRAVRVKGLLSGDEQELVDAFAKALAGHLSTNTEGARSATEHPLQEEPSMTPEQIKALEAELARFKAVEAAALAAKQAEDAAKAAEAKKAADEAQARRIAELTASEVIERSRGHREPFTATPGVKVGERAEKGSGMNFARLIKARAVAKMDGREVTDVLKGWGYVDMANVVTKSLSSGSFSGMGSLVQPEFAADFIELLRNKAVVRAAGARTVPMGSSLTFHGQASAASAAYGSETGEITKSEPSTSQPLVLSEKKLTALAVLPNDLIRNVGPMAEQFVRDDLLQVIALKEDSKFFFGLGTAYEPRGLQSQLLAANKYAMTALTAAGIPTLAEVKKEIAKLKKTLKKANAPMRDMAWFFSPSIEAAISQAVGTGGEGTNVYEREMNEHGTLAGWKYFVTNQIPETSTADVFAFDMSEVIIGESMALELEAFPNGHYSSGGVAVSGISTDQTVVRSISKHDIGLRHNVSGINVTGVTWGI